jgi:hypothetical protein
MTTQPVDNGAARLGSTSFEQFAGTCAVLAGVTGFLYALAFVVLQNVLLSGLFLMFGGLFSTAVLAAVYNRLRETDATFALWALLLGVAGALGSAVHGSYDLANAIHPQLSIPDLSSPVDPRGLLTFGIAGMALFVVAWLILRGRQFSRGLGYLTYLSAILLVALYLGRLIILESTNPVILVPALLNGFLVNPALYIWLGLALLRSRGS